MFSDNLSNTVLFLIEKEKLTYETASELCSISCRYLGSIVRGKACPSVKILENLCEGLKATPNELLLPENDPKHSSSEEKEVLHILCVESADSKTYYPICPSCNKSIDREYQKFCDRCGQRLSWKNYENASIIHAPEKQSD